MGGKISKKIGKIILWMLIGFIGLDLLIVGLLFVPPIQQFVVNKVTQVLTDKWGAEISMKDVYLTPTLKLVAHDFRIQDLHHNDMIFVGTTKGRLTGISLDPFKLKFGKIHLDHGNVVLRTYSGEDSVNISLWAKVFPKKEKPNPFVLTSKNLVLTNSRFVLINDDKRVVFDTTGHPDIDYAYFELNDINWDADNFKVETHGFTTVAADFKHLAFKQYGGFVMDDASGDFSICDTALIFNKLKAKTADSKLDLDLKFAYNNWQTLGKFTDSVLITANIRPSLLAMADVAGFAPAIRGMDETFFLRADRVRGTVNDFRIINLNAGWGMFTRLNGDIAMRDITDFKNAYFNLQIDSSTVCVPDLTRFTLPGGKTIPIPAVLNNLGNTGLRLSFIGDLTDFNANLNANSAIGSAALTLYSFVDRQGSIQLKGHVSSPDLNLAKLTNSPKVLGYSWFDFDVDGNMASSKLTAENLKTLTAHLNGTIQRIDLFRYPLRNINVSADYKDRFYNGTVSIHDPHLKCDILAQLDQTEQSPSLQGNISLQNLDISDIAHKLAPIDSSKASGFDRLLYNAQQSSDVKLSFDNFMVALNGSSLDNVNGYLGCDNILFKNNKNDLANERLRLTAINRENFHKFILSSNIANASLESTYPITAVTDSIKNIVQLYFPDLLSKSVERSVVAHSVDSSRRGYIKAHVTTYNTRNLIRLFNPDLFIASNSEISLDMGSDGNEDHITANIPFIGIRQKLALYHLSLDGHANGERAFDLNLRFDSTIIVTGSSRIPFDKIDINTHIIDDTVNYNIAWINRFNHDTSSQSLLSGMVSIDNLDDISLNIRNSAIYLNDHKWAFNEGNAIHFKKDSIVVHDLILSDDQKRGLQADGSYSAKKPSNMHLKINDIDIEMLNPVLKGMEMRGLLSADFTLRNFRNRLITYGKAMVNDFEFNQDAIGDIFALAALDTTGAIRFTGGIFQESRLLDAQELATFDVRHFIQSQERTANIEGSYKPEKRSLTIHTKFDSLSAGFLSPFLASFSDYIKGKASGNLSIYASPTSSYFDGTVHVLDADMSISPLGTNYLVHDQDIFFNKEGIFFKHMQLKDIDGNIGYMDGSIRHNFFRDMKLNLTILSDRIMVLNTPKDPTTVFYGKGYVSGKIQITGDEDEILFSGKNLQTLTGSHITLQVSSSNSASQSGIIHFKPKTVDDNVAATETEPDDSKANIVLDFTFDVKNDAIITLFLETIGGTLNARADGRFQLVYNNHEEDLNLYGNIALHSGDMKIALYNIINSRLSLVPGGTIHFDGPLDNMVVNISACKSTKTSLANIVPASYNIGNSTNVNAYMHLNGHIMQKFEPSFSFELPNSNEETRNIFYNAIDTTNHENVTKQFAYYLVSNSFMTTDIGSSNSGLSLAHVMRNMLNSMLSELMENQKGSFGITYNPETDNTVAEYGLTANASLLNDRMTLETSIGYYDDNKRSAANNMYGDLTLQYSLNKEGTWKVKAYTNIGERNEMFYLHDNQINYVAGVALAFKQEFNSLKKRKLASKKVKRKVQP